MVQGEVVLSGEQVVVGGLVEEGEVVPVGEAPVAPAGGYQMAAVVPQQAAPAPPQVQTFQIIIPEGLKPGAPSPAPPRPSQHPCTALFSQHGVVTMRRWMSLHGRVAGCRYRRQDVDASQRPARRDNGPRGRLSRLLHPVSDASGAASGYGASAAVVAFRCDGACSNVSLA